MQIKIIIIAFIVNAYAQEDVVADSNENVNMLSKIIKIGKILQNQFTEPNKRLFDTSNNKTENKAESTEYPIPEIYQSNDRSINKMNFNVNLIVKEPYNSQNNAIPIISQFPNEIFQKILNFRQYYQPQENLSPVHQTNVRESQSVPTPSTPDIPLNEHNNSSMNNTNSKLAPSTYLITDDMIKRLTDVISGTILKNITSYRAKNGLLSAQEQLPRLQTVVSVESLPRNFSSIGENKNFQNITESEPKSSQKFVPSELLSELTEKITSKISSNITDEFVKLKTVIEDSSEAYNKFIKSYLDETVSKYCKQLLRDFEEYMAKHMLAEEQYIEEKMTKLRNEMLENIIGRKEMENSRKRNRTNEEEKLDNGEIEIEKYNKEKMNDDVVIVQEDKEDIKIHKQNKQEIKIKDRNKQIDDIEGMQNDQPSEWKVNEETKKNSDTKKSQKQEIEKTNVKDKDSIYFEKSTVNSGRKLINTPREKTDKDIQKYYDQMTMNILNGRSKW